MKLKKRLFKRLAIISVVSVLLTAVFSTTAFWFVFSDQAQEELQNYTQSLVDTYNIQGEAKFIEGYICDNHRVTLITPDGTVLLDSDRETVAETMENHSDRPEFKTALEQGYGSSYRTSATLNNITYYYAIKTDDGNVIRASIMIDSVIDIFVEVLPAIICIIIVVFVICITMSRISARRIIEPIEKMAENIKDTPYEELVPLAETISRQQKEIRKQVRRLQLEKNKINTLIQNMSEGFILIDMDKNVLMSNYSASKLLGARGAYLMGESLLTYSKNEIVVECVDSALDGVGKNGDLTINGRALQLITNPVYSNDKQNGVICLIIDISAKKKAEKMRREFTANVTHELKTPLTSISGYAEIISSGFARPDDIQGFAKKIHKESGRLLSLIGDIMKLSQLDEGSSTEDFVSVDLSSVAYEVAEDLQSNAQKQNVEIIVDAQTAVINGRKNQIYELIYNLCDNAIRYNRPDGKVIIKISDDGLNSEIRVTDTGIGIEEKHRKRIFERFYRVDKSRSKETGGTGLGLAIVKHIAELHGGSVTLESSEKGSSFIVKF